VDGIEWSSRLIIVWGRQLSRAGQDRAGNAVRRPCHAFSGRVHDRPIYAGTSSMF